MAVKENGGVTSRLGIKFYEEIEKIKDARLRNGNSRDRISTVRITNLIIRHIKWKDIFSAIVDSSEEEVRKFGT